jgi:hypothetical protein
MSQANALQPTIYIPSGPAFPTGTPCRGALAELRRGTQIRGVS